MKIPRKQFEHFSWNFNEPMGVDKEVKVATVDVESGDNMATLPASSRSHHSSENAEKNAAAIKEMEIKNVMPKPLERLLTFQNYYAISDEMTHTITFNYFSFEKLNRVFVRLGQRWFLSNQFTIIIKNASFSFHPLPPLTTTRFMFAAHFTHLITDTYSQELN